MAARPRLRAPGLRGRIVGLVLFTTVATLGVAAAALLGPLESSLRHAALKTLRVELTPHTRVTRRFSRLDPSLALNAYIVPGASKEARRLRDQGRDMVNRLDSLLSRVGSRVGASEVTLLDFPNRLVATTAPDLSQGDNYGDGIAAFGSHRVAYSFGTINDKEYVRAALPFEGVGGRWWVLAIRKPIDEIPAAVNAVARAFLTAALAGLALTLILGIPLSATLVYRLRRLRQAAVRVSQEGPGVEVPADRARDEVGDLARTFATMQGQLRRQEEARRAFVATASHELRTPLTSLAPTLDPSLLMSESRRSTMALPRSWSLTSALDAPFPPCTCTSSATLGSSV